MMWKGLNRFICYNFFGGKIVVILYFRFWDLVRDWVKYLVVVFLSIRLILLILVDVCCKEILNYVRIYVNLMVIFMELLICYILLWWGMLIL